MKRSHSILGLLLVLTGLAANPWAIGYFFADDKAVQGVGKVSLILACQAGIIGLGLTLLLRRSVRTVPAGAAALAGLACLGGVAAGGWGTAGYFGAFLTPEEVAASRQIKRMVKSEDLLLDLMGPMLRLDASVFNLRFPDQRSIGLFAPQVRHSDVTPAEPKLTQALDSVATRFEKWTVEENLTEAAAQDLRLWEAVLDQASYFDNAHFKVVRGDFQDDADSIWLANTSFGGTARLKNGEWLAVSASMMVRWERLAPDADKAADQWLITEWKMTGLKTIRGREKLFEESLDAALPDPATLTRARRSLHEEMVVQSLTDENFKPTHKWFRHQSQDEHPSVVTADVDQDGLDDLYVVEREGRNMLLRNRGDGTFEETAGRHGLDFDGRSNCALFADFDNDGDPDLFLGRSIERSLLLMNEGGRYVDRSADVAGGLPFFATSAAAADYDGDGLLDLYVSTYAGKITYEAFRDRSPMARSLLDEFLPAEDATALYEKMKSAEAHVILNMYGPPNVLLHNEGGGRMRVAREHANVFLFMNTYQGSWGDYDNDGDPDLYCASDFAPNNFFRNDGGKFTEVTAETGTADIGFGMGASWGDYDNDGLQDLYVTNMFSKAGRRITDQVSGIDPRFAMMARGNSLFRNQPGGAFPKVSGLEPPALMVENGGWGWCGQFQDVNHDGWLDIYNLAGYYTAPKEFAVPYDT